MSYVSKVLGPDEVVLYIGRLHWAIYIPGLVLIICSLAFMFCLVFVGSPILDGLTPKEADKVIGAAIVVSPVALPGFLLLISELITRWTTEIAVTSRRVILKRGLVRRETMEMNLDKIESVRVSQSIIGRMLNYGTIDVRGSGAGIEGLRRVDSPLTLRSYIEESYEPKAKPIKNQSSPSA